MRTQSEYEDLPAPKRPPMRGASDYDVAGSPAGVIGSWAGFDDGAGTVTG